MYNFVYNIGSSVINIGKFIGGHSKFCVLVCVRGLEGGKIFNPAVVMATLRQIYFTGVELFYIMTFAALILGMAIVGGLSKLMILLGAKEAVGPFLTLVIIRSVGPVVTGLLLILRSSTSFLVEIGMMKYNREIKTLEAMNIDPYCYVYLPRILASLISMIVLSTYFGVVSIIGGYTLLSFQLDTTLDNIMTQIVLNISFSDVASFLFQTILIGFIAASIPIYTALEAKRSQTDIVKSFVFGMMRLFFAFIIILILGGMI